MSALRRLTAPTVSLATLALMAATAVASPPAPSDLRVTGGEERWHSVNWFRLEWENPSTSPPIAAVHYRILDPFGAVARPQTRIGWPASLIDALRVPGGPGAYTAEIWLEDGGGSQGPPAVARLRFDDVRPGSASPHSQVGWIGRTAFPRAIRIDPPVEAPPVSGIRGYAVSVDGDPQGKPCAGQLSCTDAETDLRGGIGDNTFQLAELPDGISYLHAVAVSGSGMRSATPGHAVLRIDKTDPVTRLAGAPAEWANQPVRLTVTATDAASGMGLGGGATSPTPFTAVRVDGGTPTVAVGDSVSTTVIEEGVHAVAHYARDAAGNVNDGATVNGLENRPPASAVVRIDRSPPVVSFLNSQDHRDPELIEVRVTDRLSGADLSRGWIGVRRVGSGDPFEALPRENGGSGLRARWNSDAHPVGVYEFHATGYDAAGNSAGTARRSDGTSMTLSNPLKATTALSAGFGGEILVWQSCVRRSGARRCRRRTISAFESRPSRRVVPYGRRSLFSGRLITGIGTPVENAPIEILERIEGSGDGAVRGSTVRTSAGGRFSIRLASGPSREISARFPGNRTLARSLSRPVRLGVRTRLRLRVSSTTATVGGRPVVFSGSVAAPPGAIPTEGKAVELQFRLPGHSWTGFRTVRTDRRGRFRHAYRFADDDSRGVRFQFRAYAPAQGGWSYEPGGSKPVVVHGR